MQLASPAGDPAWAGTGRRPEHSASGQLQALPAVGSNHAWPYGQHAPRSAPPAALRLRFRYALQQLMSPARESSRGLGRACRALEAGARTCVRSVVGCGRAFVTGHGFPGESDASMT
jgi:hypothetical protein